MIGEGEPAVGCSPEAIPHLGRLRTAGDDQHRPWCPLSDAGTDGDAGVRCAWPVPSGGAPYQNKSSCCLQCTALASCCQASSIVDT